MGDVLVFARCRFPSIDLGPCSVTMANFGEKLLSVDIYLDFDTFAQHGVVLTSTMKDNKIDFRMETTNNARKINFT